MPRRHDHLFDSIANFAALHAAARRAVKGKRKKSGAAGFFANLERELLTLERELQEGSNRHLDDETRAAVEEGLAQAERGEFVPDEVVAEADKRRGI